MKKYYKADSAAYKARAIKNKINTGAKISLLKGVPCSDCGQSFHPCAMDFDHRPGTVKKFNIAHGHSRFSAKTVAEEIAKCDIVCANCHRLRTFLRHGKNKGKGI